VGLGVHQATTSATVRDSRGKIIERSILPTEEAALHGRPRIPRSRLLGRAAAWVKRLFQFDTTNRASCRSGSVAKWG
jgi:hypothetical protein